MDGNSWGGGDKGATLLSPPGILKPTSKGRFPCPQCPTDSVTYTYGDDDWGDLLTAYDGTAIDHDNVGNLTSDGTWTYTWEHGRQLASMTDGTTTISYTYNAEGLRIGKVVTRSNYSETHEYYYNNGNLSCDLITVVDNGVTSNHHLKISYDESGRPLVITYKNRSYFYLLNAQGDVMGISGVYGDLKVAYTYDAWGNVLSVTGPLADTLGYWNPCRYRGYVYDRETGFYYCNSRYYNPEIGRWISPEPNVYYGEFDEAAGLLGYNVYAYCANNPINYFDPTGEFIISTLLICVAVGVVAGGTIGGIAGNAYANSKGYTGWNKTKSILTGVGIGGFAGGALGYFGAPTVISATGIAGISVTSGGITTIVALGTSFGKLGTLIANNGQQIIDWGKTTWHGMQRMIERGVTQNMVEAWVKTGKALQQAGDKILYITKQGAVVIDKAGRVITAYTSQYFDPAMKKVVEKLFGK